MYEKVANTFIVNFVLGVTHSFRFYFLNNQVGVCIYNPNFCGIVGRFRAWTII
jgi:hypothetical protein